jgi:hypothetical protein
MDGRIEVASGAGATTFSLELPTAPPSPPSNGGGGSP